MSLNCGHQRAYCSPTSGYINTESRGGMILTGKTKELGAKTCPSVTLFITKAAWNGPGANHVLRGGRQAINRLRHDTSSGGRLSVCGTTGRAMAQIVSHRPLTAESRVRVRVNPCGICGGQSGTGTGFSPSSSVFPCQYHSTVALQTHII
jgi:hypothetical protein